MLSDEARRYRQATMGGAVESDNDSPRPQTDYYLPPKWEKLQPRQVDEGTKQLAWRRIKIEAPEIAEFMLEVKELCGEYECIFCEIDGEVVIDTYPEDGPWVAFP